LGNVVESAVGSAIEAGPEIYISHKGYVSGSDASSKI
jgi:hypothetical protein